MQLIPQRKLAKILFFALSGLLFSFYATNSFAQQPSQNWQQISQMLIDGKVEGSVTDAASGQPVEYATVVLMKRDSVAAGALTDKNGAFLLQVNHPGRYKLKVSFIGFQDFMKDSIFVTPRQTEVSVGKISLSANEKVLKEVVVKGQESPFVQGIDKKVFNVEKSIVTTGGSASDVLQQIPSVSLDMDGNVELRGSGNVVVLIDGKPSGLTGPNKASILQQIPANTIESIEVITNPSVKYDPDGMSGIINIVLKKDRKAGMNGSVTTSVGNRDKYNGSALFNYKKNWYNISASYSYRHNDVFHIGNSMRGNFFPDTTWYLRQHEFSNSISNAQMGKLAFDFYLNKNNTISLSSTYNYSTEPSERRTDYANLDSLNNPFQTFYRAGNETETNKTLDLTADYRKTFTKQGESLTANASYSNNQNQELDYYGQADETLFGQTVPANLYNQHTNTQNPFTVASIQADYVLPFKGKAKFETGYKTILRRTEQDFYSEHNTAQDTRWLADTNLNNSFVYNEGVHAVYASYTNGIKEFTYQLGLRAEDAITSSHLLTTKQDFKKNYVSFFPNLQLMQNFGKEQTVTLSFSRRINRPRLGQLNPFPDYDDPLNLRSGNPYLKPEYTNSVELGYSKFFKKFSITGSGYYRYITGMMSYVRQVDTTGISRTSVVNLNTGKNFGLELMSRITPYKWWNITASFNFFRTILDATNIESALTNAGFGSMGKMMSSMYMPKGFQFQLSGFYHGPMTLPQGRMRSMYSLDAGLKKDILKNKGSLSLNVSDIFNTRRFSVYGAGTNFTTDFTHKRESRIVMLSFTYRFGKNDESMQKKGRKPGNGESEGMDDDGF